MYSKICGLLISVLLALSIFNVGSISVKAEAVYNVGLEIETLDIPINWLQDGDGVSLMVKIKNNPGVDDFSFCYKTDDKIKDDLYSMIVTKGEYPSWNITTYIFNNPVKTYRDEIFTHDRTNIEKFSANGGVCYIIVHLDSDNLQIGDFYPVEFVTEPIDHDYDIGFTIDDIFYDYKNITEYINGGVRVVEPRLKYTPVEGNQVIEEQSVQPQQSAEVQHQDDKQNNDSNTPFNEIEQSEVSQSVSETVITTNDITVSNTETKIITTATKKVTSEKKISESSVSVTEGAVESTTSEYHIDNTQKNKEENKVVKPVIFSSVLVLAAITVTLLIRKIKRKKEDR